MFVENVNVTEKKITEKKIVEDTCGGEIRYLRENKTYAEVSYGRENRVLKSGERKSKYIE